MRERGYVVEPPATITDNPIPPPRVGAFLALSKKKMHTPKKQEFGRQNLLVQVILYQCLTLILNTMEKNAKNTENQTVVENSNNHTLTVMSVRVVEKSEKSKLKANTVFLTFKEEYEVFTKDEDTGLFIKTKTNVMSKSVGITSAILADVNEDIAMLLSMPISAVVDKDDLSDMEKMQVLLAAFLVGSKVVINSEEHSAGEVIDGVALTRDMMFNNIVNVVFTDRAKKLAKELAESKIAKLLKF